MSTFIDTDGVIHDVPGIVIDAQAEDVAEYLALDAKVDAAEGEGLMARWEFGRCLLAEREANGGKQLPHGRLEAICAATNKSASEVRYRVQFADRYRTREEVTTAVETFRSWTSLRDEFSASSGNGSQVSNNSGRIEWFTPAEYIQAAVRLMGGIDLDPASTAEANRVVGAATFYTAEDDGLSQQWAGRVWMNPPYAAKLIAPFCQRLADSYATGDVTEACALVNSATETAWFHVLADQAAAMCFPLTRVKFWHPDKDAAAGPLQGQTVFYFGANVRSFRAEFSRFGFTVTL